MPTRRKPVVLTIAGSDSFGGAGIQADLKTFMAMGVHGTTAITALTAQNSRGVTSVHGVPPSFVSEQISQILSDAPVGAAKTGMLWSGAIIEAVADSLSRSGLEKVVVDPVLISTSRAELIQSGALRSLVDRLLPLALIVTPNLSEAAALSGEDVETFDQMKDAARRIKDMGPDWVLIKGGHLAGDPLDLLFDGVTFVELHERRVLSASTHGSGCTLAAALTARLALGDQVEAAVRAGKRFVTRAIASGYSLGAGAGPVNQAFDAEETVESPD